MSGDADVFACPNCGARPPGTIAFPFVCPCGLVATSETQFSLRVIDTVPAYRRRIGSSMNTPNGSDFSAAVQAALSKKNEEGAAAWAELHLYEGNDPGWFQSIWEPMIPRFGCDCEAHYRKIRCEWSPDFRDPDSFLLSGFELHNKVNALLHRPTWSIDESMKRWRPQSGWNIQQPRISGCVAVTSFYAGSRVDQQQEALRSWQNFGLQVKSGNLADDAIFPSRGFERFEASPSFGYDRRSPTINSLLRGHGQNAVLLINSDIALYEDQSVIVDALRAKRSMAIIRHNWVSQPARNKRELWGIDAFLLYPDQIATLPELPLAIGQPMWDYWIPYHLKKIGCDITWIGAPMAYHEAHDVAWQPEAVSRGADIVCDAYGEKLSWADWRRQQPFSDVAHALQRHRTPQA